MLYADLRPLELLRLRKQVNLHLSWKQCINRVVCLNMKSYFNVIMSLRLKAMWQSCLRNAMLTF